MMKLKDDSNFDNSEWERERVCIGLVVFEDVLLINET